MTEQELLIDCLKRLNQVGLAYLLTASMASNYWGIPRSTPTWILRSNFQQCPFQN